MIFFSKISKRIKKLSFFLFLVPTLGILLSLIFHNILVEFKVTSMSENYKDPFPIILDCNEKNDYCRKIERPITKKFEECNKYELDYYVLIDDKKKISYKNYLDLYIGEYRKSEQNKEFIKPKLELSKKELNSLKIDFITFETNILNDSCIKNKNYYSLYKIFPNIFYFMERIRSNKKFDPGTNKKINPFIYGETSISNIVKRFPINFVFKPLLFVTSILMLLYWINYQKFFNNIYNVKKINKFTIFGIFSSIFLFFHVIFLGSEIDNKIFQSIRKLILVLFILFEILAQFFLTKRLYLEFGKIEKYIYKKILNIKIIFVAAIVISTIFILSILVFYNLDSKIDNILEWNYFILLLFFYLLSSIIWKKQKK